MYLLWNCVFHLKRNFHEVSLCGSFYLKEKLSYQPTSYKMCMWIYFLYNRKKKDFEKFKLTLFCPKSDKYLISPSSITHESNIKIERLKEMTANYT